MIVYCAKGNDVSDVIIDGEIVMRDGAFLNLDESKIIDKAKERIESFWLDKESR
jgi:cytosine/adenosine deaminase-related metal-dependent hydrolase